MSGTFLIRVVWERSPHSGRIAVVRVADGIPILHDKSAFGAAPIADIVVHFATLVVVASGKSPNHVFCFVFMLLVHSPSHSDSTSRVSGNRLPLPLLEGALIDLHAFVPRWRSHAHRVISWEGIPKLAALRVTSRSMVWRAAVLALAVHLAAVLASNKLGGDLCC